MSLGRHSGRQVHGQEARIQGSPQVHHHHSAWSLSQSHTSAVKLKARKDHRTTQTVSQKIAGETVLSIGWILQLAAKVVHCKSCSGEWPEQCKCCPGIKAESDQNGFQVLRERVRSTTEGEVLLNRLLGGEGSALGEMVRWAVSTFLKVKKGFWKSNKFWMDQVSLFKAFESQIVLNKVKWTLNGSGCPTGGWRRCSLGWQLLDSKIFALFLRSNVSLIL